MQNVGWTREKTGMCEIEKRLYQIFKKQNTRPRSGARRDARQTRPVASVDQTSSPVRGDDVSLAHQFDDAVHLRVIEDAGGFRPHCGGSNAGVDFVTEFTKLSRSIWVCGQLDQAARFLRAEEVGLLLGARHPALHEACDFRFCGERDGKQVMNVARVVNRPPRKDPSDVVVARAAPGRPDAVLVSQDQFDLGDFYVPLSKNLETFLPSHRAFLLENRDNRQITGNQGICQCCCILPCSFSLLCFSI